MLVIVYERKRKNVEFSEQEQKSIYYIIKFNDNLLNIVYLNLNNVFNFYEKYLN